MVPLSLPANLQYSDTEYPGAEPPTPQWVLDAAAEHDRADLASVANTDGDGFHESVAAGFRALGLCDPRQLAAAGHGRAVLDGIVAAHRVIAHLQAVQQRWIAAFAQPGVAVPMDATIDAAGTLLAESFGAEVPATVDGDVDVAATLAHPVWRPAVVDTAARFAAAEIACATHLAPITARMRVERAAMMVNSLPATLAAQQTGYLDGYRAAIIADGVAVLPAELRPQVEHAVLASASSGTASELRRHVARAVIAADPAGAAERAATAAKSRHTKVTAVENDMALFQAVLSAPDALMAHGVLDTVAASLKAAGIADGRGSGQLRADAFADLFRALATTGHAHVAIPDCSEVADRTTGIEPCRGHVPSPTFGGSPCSSSNSRLVRPSSLNVYIDFPTLSGLADHPAEIAGYGIVTAGTARALAASAEAIRALITHSEANSPETSRAPADRAPAASVATSPGAGSERAVHSSNVARSRVCGTVVDPGRAVYRPPESTAEYIQNRDRHCQFPGCHVAAQRCDLDHRVPYQHGGATCPCNMDALCRSHHRLKTFTSWRAAPDSAGRLVWTSPLGHTYTLASEPCTSLPWTSEPRIPEPQVAGSAAAAPPAPAARTAEYSVGHLDSDSAFPHDQPPF